MVLRTVEVGEVGELVHQADHTAIGRSGQPVFQPGPLGLDQLRRYSVRGQQFSERVRKRLSSDLAGPAA